MTRMPLGWKNGKPGPSSWKLKRSSSRPSLRWSRCRAISRRARYSSSSFLEANAVP